MQHRIYPSNVDLAWHLAADTIYSHSSHCIGKPFSKEHVKSILDHRARKRMHQTYTHDRHLRAEKDFRDSLPHSQQYGHSSQYVEPHLDEPTSGWRLDVFKSGEGAIFVP